jgi:hypothetical protein
MTGRLTTWVASALLAAFFGWPLLANAQVDAPLLQPFSKSTTDALPVPWRLVGLPKGRVPMAQLAITTLGYDRVLKLATDKSYGTALHEVTPQVLPPGSLLKWRWRLEQPNTRADLRTKEGDDAPLKVCAMFDLPLDKLKFVERNLVRIARSISGEKLPGATLCYVWDHRLLPGTQLPNAYSERVRFIVLDSGDRQLGEWMPHERDLAADLQTAFGHEFDTPPPLIAILVGADSDNTQAASVGYIGDVVLTRPKIVSMADTTPLETKSPETTLIE